VSRLGRDYRAPDDVTKNTEKFIESLRQYLRKKTGVKLAGDEKRKLRRALDKRIDELGLNSLEQYASHLSRTPDEMMELIGEATINHTFFFREEDHWDFLKDRIIPEWQGNKVRLNAWSAGCARGQEPYSLAMVLQDKWAGNGNNGYGKFRVLGSDIAKPALNNANRACYPKKSVDSIREYNAEYVDRYLERTENGRYEISPDLRSKIVFRNVLVYFPPELVQDIINKFEVSLKREGYFYLGHGETLMGIDHSLTRIRQGIFKKVD